MKLGRVRQSVVKISIWSAGLVFMVVTLMSMQAYMSKLHINMPMLSAQAKYDQTLYAAQQTQNHTAITPLLRVYTGEVNTPFNDAPTTTSNGAPILVTKDVPTKPAVHIGFLKVHKAASTTTQGIFLRYGWRRNLTFILPPEYNPFGYPNIISTIEPLTNSNTLQPPPGKTFDIMCHHVLYGQKSWATFLPNDTVVIGTVREPYRHFKSVLNYFNPRSILNIKSEDPIGTYLANPMTYEAKLPRHSFLNNRVAFEYGVSEAIIIAHDIDAFNEYLKNVLAKQFAVVLVAEQFDESLILMKRKLNWPLQDIMYATKNMRSAKKPDRYVVDEKHRPLHRQFAVLDYLLYEFFLARLSEEMAREGETFTEELEHFKATRAKVETFCHGRTTSLASRDTFKVPKSKFNDEFVIDREECLLLHEGEIAFTQKIRVRQYGEALWAPKTH